jgi:divalent metal cation (Fe/Co/Zn/Cd) transporter
MWASLVASIIVFQLSFIIFLFFGSAALLFGLQRTTSGTASG